VGGDVDIAGRTTYRVEPERRVVAFTAIPEEPVPF
jgi:hypothetical protein